MGPGREPATRWSGSRSGTPTRPGWSGRCGRLCSPTGVPPTSSRPCWRPTTPRRPSRCAYGPAWPTSRRCSQLFLARHAGAGRPPRCGCRVATLRPCQGSQPVASPCRTRARSWWPWRSPRSRSPGRTAAPGWTCAPGPAARRVCSARWPPSATWRWWPTSSSRTVPSWCDGPSRPSRGTVEVRVGDGRQVGATGTRSVHPGAARRPVHRARGPAPTARVPVAPTPR